MKSLQSYLTLTLGVAVVSVLQPPSLQAHILPPVITSLSPASGTIGSTVMITGANFAPAASNNIVTFGAVTAPVLSAAVNSLTVSVPEGATFQYPTVTTGGLIGFGSAPFRVASPGADVINSGSLSASVSLATGSGPTDVKIADVDGDGKPDLVIDNWNDGTISIYRNISTNGSLLPGSFAAPVTFAVGANPYFMTVGDIDGDGKPDVVVANGGGTTISVFHNISTPGTFTTNSFAPRVDLQGGTGPIQVAIVDIDGDGKPDLVAANSGGSTISVWQNIGSTGSLTTNSFAPQVQFATGSGPRWVGVGDLDGDGKPDLVVCNSGANSLSILRNISSTGSITTNSFAAAINYSTGSRPFSIGIGDLDGDGRPDLAVLNYNGGTISIFHNTNVLGSTLSSNSFAARFDLSASASGQAIMLGDLDGDGKLDLFIASQSTEGVSVFHNISTNGVLTAGSFASPVLFGTGSNPVGLAIGDLDGDGKADVVTANDFSDSLSIFHNVTLQTPVPLPPVITSLSPASGTIGSTVTITGTNFAPAASNNIVTFGAVTAPVLSAATNSLTVSVPEGATFQYPTVTTGGLIGFGNAPFRVTFPSVDIINSGSLSAPVSLATGSGPTDVKIADMDGDGKPDLVIDNWNDGTISIYRNISTNGSLLPGSFAAPVTFAVGANPYFMTVGDIDGDGKPDVVVGYGGGTAVSIFQNISTPGTFTTNSLAARVDLQTGGAPVNMAIIDVDGDGKADLIVANGGGSTISVLRNIGNAGLLTTNSFAPRVDFAVGNAGSNPTGVAVGDFDGDGKPDLAVCDSGADTVSILRNTSIAGAITTNSFAPAINLATGARPYGVAVGDLDGDGRLDVAVLNYNGGTISIFQNTNVSGSALSSNSFAPRFDLSASSEGQVVAIGDLDGDGKLDLFITSQSSEGVSVFHNIGTNGVLTAGSFASPVLFGTGSNPVGLAIGDLDGDGKADVVTANDFSDSLSIFHNTSSATNQLGTAPTITVQPKSGSAIIGGTAAFSVTATGTAPLSYQWSFNAAQIIGATGSSLALTNVQTTNAGSYSVTVTNSAGFAVSSNAVLTVTAAAVSTLQVVPATVAAGNTVTVSIDLIALGTENAAGFSVDFDPSILTYTNATIGSGASGATFIKNTAQSASGRLGVGISLPIGTTFAAGTHEVTKITFQVAIVTNVATQITFGSQPAQEQVSDVNAQDIPAVYTSGGITITAPSYYGDVAPRTNGDGIVSITDWVQEGRFVAGLDTISNASELQRADCAPVTHANGHVNVADWVQVGRYAIGLDPLAPISGSAPAKVVLPKMAKQTLTHSVNATCAAQGGMTNTVSVVLSAQGDENAISFSLSFDPKTAQYAGASLGGGASGAVLNINANQAASGLLGFALAMQPGTAFAAGDQQIVNVQFASILYSNKLSVAFGDTPIAQALADTSANILDLTSQGTTIRVGGTAWPALSASQFGSNIVLSWPASAVGFLPEIAPTVGTNWSPIAGTLETNGDVITMTLPASDLFRIYRLRHQ